MITILAACVIIGFLKTAFIIITYYTLSAILIWTLDIVYQSKNSDSKRKSKRLLKIINLTKTSDNAEIRKFANWLKNEGFILKINTYTGSNLMYLQSKTVKIQYFPSLLKRISISSIEGTDYLIYLEDEELKLKLNSYLSYLYDQYYLLRRDERNFAKLNPKAVYSRTGKSIYLYNAWNILIRLQGYGMMLLILIFIPENHLDILIKLLIFSIYGVVENI